MTLMDDYNRKKRRGREGINYEALTPQERMYVENAERQLKTDKLIEKLIFEWTNKTHAEQGEIIGRTPKGKHWAQQLAEESKDHMKNTAYKMTLSDLVARLNDLRAFEYIRATFSDILYEVYEQRKKNESLGEA